MEKRKNIQFVCDQQMGIEIIRCNNSTLSYPMHNHISMVAIGMVLEGSITVNTIAQSTTYNTNDSFVLLPYIPHSITAKDQYSMVNVCINKKNFDVKNLPTLQGNLLHLLSVSQSLEDLSFIQIEQIMRCVENICQKSMISSSLPMNRIRKQIELYPEERMSIEELAKATYISKYHFIRCFKEEVGLSPHQFQIQNRVRKAKRLLTQKDSLTEVALTTGFCDQSHFIKQFKKIVGLTPSIYKDSFTSI